MSPYTVIVTALGAEANPIKEFWQLSHCQDTAYRCWQNDDMFLIESGIGKCNSAAATASALTRVLASGVSSKRIICINYGIAGGSYDIGTPVTAQSIHDHATNQRWYPSLTFRPQGETTDLVCVDTPSSDYQQGMAFDMESSGFFTAARRFVGHEFIHCFKIISDNPENDFQSITKQSAMTLIQSGLSPLAQLMSQLATLHNIPFDGDDIETLTQRVKQAMHITRTQGHQLQRLLERHLALNGNLPKLNTLLELKRASLVISTLTQQLDQTTPHY